MRLLYFDCFSGISGDMAMAALVDAGADRAYISEELVKLQLEPYTLEWQPVTKLGISGLKFNVIPDPAHPPAHHRHYAEIVEAIRRAGFNERVTALSLKMFERIGRAEAKIHNVPLERVHFHEVGAIDSIVDIVGVALAIDALDVHRIVSSPLPLGSGTVRCDHGIYPVPAPATLEMMKGLPIAPSKHRVELTTPTGAAIISALADSFSPSLPTMIVESVGYGAGTRDLPEQPNVLRAVIGRSEEHPHEHPHEPTYDHEHAHPHSHAHDHHHAHHHEPHDHRGHHHHGHDRDSTAKKHRH